MQQVHIHNVKQIQQELSQLGFDNVDEIVGTAKPLYTSQDPEAAGILFFDPGIVNNENPIGYDFEFKRVGKTSEWQLDLVSAYVQIKTNNTKNGMQKGVSWYWHATDGPLPHKERMRWQVTRAAKIESAKESFLSRPAAINSASPNITDSLAPLSKDLETALKHLGFQYSPEMLQTATYADNLAFLTIREKPDFAQSHEFDSFAFFFAVVYPENETPLQIEYINASLNRKAPEIGDPKEVFQKDYWLSKEDLPTKNQVTRDLLARFNLDQARRVNAAITTIAAKDRSPGHGLRH